MKKLYFLLSCFCITSGIFYSPLATAGDTLFLSTKLKPSFFLRNPSNGASQFKSGMGTNSVYTDIKGSGDDNSVPIVFTGSFRFNAMYRDMYHPYTNSAGVKPKNLLINGFGDGLLGASPLLTLYGKITPAPGVDIGIGMGFNHLLTGSIDPDSTRSRFPFGQTFGATFNYKTRFGNIRIGGGNLYSGMSQLFSGWPTIRWNPFYRLPWDVSPQWGGAWTTYEGAYKNGSVTNFDAAYANGGRTQGVIVQLSDLPNGFGFNFSYGVDGQTGLYQLSAGDSLTANAITKKTIGGRLYKKVNAHAFGITGILNNGYTNNVSNFRETQHMFSTDAVLVFNNITINAEVGATAFTNPFGKYNGTLAGNQKPWDTTEFKSGVNYIGQVRVLIKKQLIGIPLSLNFYQLGPYFINLNSGPFNSSTYNNTAAYLQINSSWDPGLRKGFIADVGQATNNRRALEAYTNLEKGRFKVGIGTQVGTEIQKSDSATNQVLFYHKLNAWSRASFNYWTPQGGPYKRLLGNYIQLLENVSITDAIVNYRKTFNVFNIDARYKTSFLGKSLIIANYISYQSASPKFSPLPYLTKNAFVRVFYNELTSYWQLNKTTVLVGQAAFNKAVGNNRTTLSADNGKPIDQRTWGVGGGIDWNFAPMMGLYFREMWMSHRDKNFSLDRFASFETTIEIKVMF